MNVRDRNRDSETEGRPAYPSLTDSPFVRRRRPASSPSPPTSTRPSPPRPAPAPPQRRGWARRRGTWPSSWTTPPPPRAPAFCAYRCVCVCVCARARARALTPGIVCVCALIVCAADSLSERAAAGSEGESVDESNCHSR